MQWDGAPCRKATGLLRRKFAVYCELRRANSFRPGILMICGIRGIKKEPFQRTVLSLGASDEARTRYLHLGKVALYQMSYTRGDNGYYSRFPENVNTLFQISQKFFKKIPGRCSGRGSVRIRKVSGWICTWAGRSWANDTPGPLPRHPWPFRRSPGTGPCDARPHRWIPRSRSGARPPVCL